jgi:uncharacterized protein YPO0396
MMLDRPKSQLEIPSSELSGLLANKIAVEETSNPGAESSFLLSQLEVYNWGPFKGLHRADFDPAGTAIIGPTGSGKTTLVDALMTLLVASPRYNLASTGGHESDRTLIEYVRGVLGGDGADGRQEVARPGKTMSGICATYLSGEHALRLGALFWTEGTGNSADDLKRRWVFSLAADHTFEKWLRVLHDDGLRELLKIGRDTAGLRLFDSKRSYLERVRKFFDVGENAFTLLNRAAGLKQLNSIDEIFRELVLDDKSAFDRAIEVAAEFDNLAAIHAELELAKKQQESLVPVSEEYNNLRQALTKTSNCRLLKRTLPVWFACYAERQWGEKVGQLEKLLQSSKSDLEKLSKTETEHRLFVDTLREKYLLLGGNVIGELENTIAIQTQVRDARRQSADQYRKLIRQFQLSDELTPETFHSNQQALKELEKRESDIREQLYELVLKADSFLRQKEAIASEIEQTLVKVKQRPGSNIPLKYQEFRAELSAQLALADGELPYLAELVEVRSTEATWRGAIERAIGSERLRILVPRTHIRQALDWVNHRDNRLHVRLLEASIPASSDRPNVFGDGYVRKLNFKTHPLSEAAKKLLSERDLHCVSSVQDLQNVEHGLTKEGMMSGRRGRFEKQDQRSLSQDWMTGFDNKDQLVSLAGQLQSAALEVSSAKQDYEGKKRKLIAADELLKMIGILLHLDFNSVDLPSAAADLAKSVDRLALLRAPDSDVSIAKAEFDKENKQLASLQNSLNELRLKINHVETNCEHAKREQAKARVRVDSASKDIDLNLAERKIRLSAEVLVEDLYDEERKWAKLVEEKLLTYVDREKEIEKQLVRRMGIAKHVDSGSLAEVGTEVDDVPHYLERLRVLNEEALPEKRTRFLEYLNRSSDQGVTQLLASIDEEVDAIEQRIGDLNHTLVKVDFREGRYLQLQPQRMKDERLRSLNIAMQKVRSAALKDDGGESHFRALQGMVDILRDAGQNRRLQGSKSLLDPRFRLQFFVVEVDRKSGDRSPPRTGSQSGSGGEKELMASHILTASLSYALCPMAASRPLYGTVILDEAFSKSSPSAASRIIEALRIFSLHPIFVTPNKEIGLLKQHTRKVICVQRPNKEASLASISWERLEDLARLQ